MADRVTIHIDGKAYQVKSGENLLQTCLSLGLDLPYFCWHPAMGSVGACRQCALVQYQNEEDQHGRIVMGCMTPVTDGAIFSLQGDKASEFRETIVESLMLNHPHDCPVCAEGGECHLQDMTVMTGHRDRHYRGLKNTHRNQYLGPLIHHEMNRCITCYRCTRFYRDYAGGTDLAAMAAHDHVYFGRHQEGVLENEFSGNLVEVCPTGVFTDKSLVNEYTRKWDLQSAPSVCTGCAVGCNTLPGERYGKLKRVHNRYNTEVNGYFICDRGRYGPSYVNLPERLDYAGLRQPDGLYNAIDQSQALQYLTEACQKGHVAGIGSPRASVESNFLLRTLVGADNFSSGFSNKEHDLVNLALSIQQQSHVLIPSVKQIETADAVLILGEDITNTAPRIALALRQTVRNKAYELGTEIGLEHWQDAAIRNLAQDQRSPLFIAAVADTRLDDVAQQILHMAPDDIALFADALACYIANEKLPDINENLISSVETIAKTLLQAKRPLIVSGTSCYNASVISATGKLIEKLNSENCEPMLSMIVPEANSLGQAMLTTRDAPTIDTLAALAIAGKINTLIVLENDLYRRCHSSSIDNMLEHIDNVIVIDYVDTATTSASSLVLPSATAIESEGTLISMEGRAQRHFPVFEPKAERLASWQWLLHCMKALGRAETEHIHYFDDVTRACAANISSLEHIVNAAPSHLYRNHGVKIPRQPHRYSGRTAMRANISVHEPKQPVDQESALAYTMEGLNQSQPGALLPYVWSPGWNSNQSLHKFQSEVSGPLKGGTAGVRLIKTDHQLLDSEPAIKSKKITPADGQWLLVPRHKIFGSDELSALSPAIAELAGHAYIEINPADAQSLNVNEGDGVFIGDDHTNDSHQLSLEVHINSNIAEGCAGFSFGFNDTLNLIPGEFVSLTKNPNWQRRQADTIATDGGGSNGGSYG